MVNKLAEAFNYSPSQMSSFLYGGEEPSTKPTTEKLLEELKKRYEFSEIIEIPIRGYVSAGTPVTAEQQDLGTLPIPKSELSGVSKVSGVYALRVSGNSLNGDQIEDGDTVIIDPNPAIIDGKIYIVRLDNEVVARHLHRENGFVVLTSSNGRYQRMEVKDLEIQGRVVLDGKWKKYLGYSASSIETV